MSSTVGAQSLPQELLEIILSDTVATVIPEERPWTALTLTHVCRSFRHVALNRPKLWTCLSRKLSRPGLTLIEACIERSKDEPLDVVLYLYGLRGGVEGSESSAVEQVMVDGMAWTILPFCARWRSFSVRLIVVDPFDHWDNVNPLADFRQLFTNLDVPMLQEFSIEEETDVFGLVPASTLLHLHPLFPPNASWNLPALHSLSLRNTHVSEVPSELRRPLRSASVSYVKRNLIYHLNTLRALAIATSLTSLRLSFKDCHFSRKIIDPSPCVIPHVKSLHIDFLGCSQISSDEHSLWKSFRTFQFPDVVDLTFLLDIGGTSFTLFGGFKAVDITLHSFLVTDFDPPCPFPRLETLDVEARSRQGGNGLWPALLLPHCCLPFLKHLRIQSIFSLQLSDRIGHVDEAWLPRYFAIGREGAPIALQTVTFDLPQVGGVAQWMRELATKMQSQCCWDGFAEIIVKNGGNDKQVISRDEVEHWCDKNLEGV